LLAGWFSERAVSSMSRRVAPLLLAVGIALSGCWARFEDVTDRDIADDFANSPIWISYQRNGAYRVKRNIFCGKVFYTARDECELFGPWAEPDAPPLHPLF